VQEALTNTLRHAGASHAQVTIRYDAPRLEVRVADDGTAEAPEGRHGHGIDGMRERAALHHGTLSAGPAPGGGWLVAAVLQPDAQPRAVAT
jgi:signal transduction histidine kinase